MKLKKNSTYIGQRYGIKIGVWLLLLSGLSATSCMKEYLEIKHDFGQVIPKSLADYQAIMDNSRVINSFSAHALGILGADEFYVRDNIFNGASRPAHEKNTYTWQKDIFGMEDIKDWDYAYKRILHCNIVIDGLKDRSVGVAEEEQKRNILGSALFVRAFTFFQLSQLFCKQYVEATASEDLGIPLRLEADINIVEKRATLAATYEQIISDLVQATSMLPSKTVVKERPTRAAALALLARVYLQQSNYEMAYKYADLTLEEDLELLDFNSLDLTTIPHANGSYYTFDGMRQTNPEVLFMSSSTTMSMFTIYVGGSLTMDTVLMASYASNDLRKSAYYFKRNATDAFIGTYTATGTVFTGLAVDEVYLIAAEAACRLGHQDIALDALNTLLSKRYDATFSGITLRDKWELLELILEERKKELVFRGVRWSDLKRLNLEPRFAQTLYRNVNGEEYKLAPNSPLYIYALPYQSVLQSSLEDNRRE